MKKVWFITGSSRGLGRSFTEAALAQGHQVAATARNPEQLQELVEKYGDLIHPIQLDVTDDAQVNKAVEAAVTQFGKIDILINNAGFGISGAAEAFSKQQIESQINTNLYGAIYVTRAVLPVMRKQRSGYIIQISSIGGRASMPGLSIYHATKFGLEGFSESVAKEVAPLGIKLTIVEPAGFRTDWGGSSMSFAKNISDYDATVGAMESYFKEGTHLPVGDPAKAAQVILKLAENPNPPMRLVLGSEGVALIKQFETQKMAEFEEWLPVSLSTDHAESQNFFESTAGKFLQQS